METGRPQRPRSERAAANGACRNLRLSYNYAVCYNELVAILFRYNEMPTINPHNHDTLIGVDPEVLEAIAADAQPFVDDPNAVLRRKLGLTAAGSQSSKAESLASPSRSRSAPKRSAKRGQEHNTEAAPRAPKGSLTPEAEFIDPILRALEEGGGELPIREVLASVGEQMANTLNEHDKFEDEKGVARWQKRVPFVRLRLVEHGLLASDAPRGMWRISPEGHEHLTNRNWETES